MTPADVQQELATIERIKDDDEAAHGLEDDLWVRVLRCIAEDTAEDPRECARLALTSCLIEFSRWYA